jgi:hypothetical protein
MFNSKKFSLEVEKKLSDYEKSFNSAFVFLSSCEAKPHKGFWLGTNVNAHLYYDEAFFAYIKLYPLQLVFNIKPHVRIKNGKVERSAKIFGKPLRALAEKHNLIRDGIVTFTDSDTMYVERNAPNKFFDDLMILLKETYARFPKIE